MRSVKLFLAAVLRPVVGEPCRKIDLERLIVRCKGRFGPQPIAKPQVAGPVITTMHHPMEQVGPCHSKTEQMVVGHHFGPDIIIAKVLQRLDQPDTRSEVRKSNQNIEDRLGPDPRNGGAAKMLDAKNKAANCRQQALLLALEQNRPLFLARHQPDFAALEPKSGPRHCQPFAEPVSSIAVAIDSTLRAASFIFLANLRSSSSAS